MAKGLPILFWRANALTGHALALSAEWTWEYQYIRLYGWLQECSFIYSHIHTFICMSIHLIIHTSRHSSVHLFICSFIHTCKQMNDRAKAHCYNWKFRQIIKFMNGWLSLWIYVGSSLVSFSHLPDRLCKWNDGWMKKDYPRRVIPQDSADFPQHSPTIIISGT